MAKTRSRKPTDPSSGSWEVPAKTRTAQKLAASPAPSVDPNLFSLLQEEEPEQEPPPPELGPPGFYLVAPEAELGPQAGPQQVKSVEWPGP